MFRSPNTKRFSMQRHRIGGSIKARVAAGLDEVVPASLVNRIIDGENIILVWREYRGLTAADLAAKPASARPTCPNWSPAKRPAAWQPCAGLRPL
jgi:hypothetical protein